VRILVVSNYYPPHFIGGYELGCQQVVQALRERGHEINVLTSSFGVQRPVQDGNVFRWLRLRQREDLQALGTASGRLEVLSRDFANQLAFDRAFKLSRPDIVYFWNLSDVSVSLAFRAEQRSPVCYFVSDSWLQNWTVDQWRQMLAGSEKTRLGGKVAIARLLFRLLGRTLPAGKLKLQWVQFCSAYLREAAFQAGVHVMNGEVVHWGVEANRFMPSAARLESTRLLYVGQLGPHKGVHTAIEALRLLRLAGAGDVRLTLVGGAGPHYQDYEKALRAQVARAGLEGSVTFAGMKPREELPSILRDYQILIFPSCWQEPFAITPLEAMASGLAVVGTTTGGSGEIFKDGVNALTFPAEDPQACARQVLRLLREPILLQDLASEGQKTVARDFSFLGMVDKIEPQLFAALRL